MTNHFVFNGFKKNKRNKRYKTLFITTKLSKEDIIEMFRICKYHYDSVVDVDSFVGDDVHELNIWRSKADIDEDLTLFDELYIIAAIGKYKSKNRR